MRVSPLGGKSFHAEKLPSLAGSSLASAARKSSLNGAAASTSGLSAEVGGIERTFRNATCVKWQFHP
jgi:hypothetical protein